MNDRPVAIVLGGTGYLGEAIVRALQDAAWDTVRASRSSTDPLGSVDIASHDSVRELFERITAAHGRIDAVVHAASPRLERVKPGIATDDAHSDVAVAGTARLLEEANRSRVPVVVVITSAAASGDPERLTMGSYPMAKRAQEDLVARYSDAHEDMLLFTVAPGFLPGGLNDDLPRAVQQTYAKRADGSMNTREEVAETIVTIVTDRERYPASGRVHPVDGSYAPF